MVNGSPKFTNGGGGGSSSLDEDEVDENSTSDPGTTSRPRDFRPGLGERETTPEDEVGNSKGSSSDGSSNGGGSPPASSGPVKNRDGDTSGSGGSPDGSSGDSDTPNFDPRPDSYDDPEDVGSTEEERSSSDPNPGSSPGDGQRFDPSPDAYDDPSDVGSTKEERSVGGGNGGANSGGDTTESGTKGDDQLVVTEEGAPDADNPIVERRLNQAENYITENYDFGRDDYTLKVTDSGGVEFGELTQSGKMDALSDQLRERYPNADGTNITVTDDGEVVGRPTYDEEPMFKGGRANFDPRPDSYDDPEDVGGSARGFDPSPDVYDSPSDVGGSVSGEQPDEMEAPDSEHVMSRGQDKGPGIETDEFEEGIVEARIERDTGEDVTVAKTEEGTFVVETERNEQLGDVDWSKSTGFDFAFGDTNDDEVEGFVRDKADAYSNWAGGIGGTVTNKLSVSETTAERLANETETTDPPVDIDEAGLSTYDTLGIEDPAQDPNFGAKVAGTATTTTLELGNAPNYVVEGMEAVELGKFIRDEDDSTREIMDVGAERGAKLADHFQENPAEAVGVGVGLAASLPVSAAGFKAIGSVSPRTATALDVATDPWKIGTRGVQKGSRAARKFASDESGTQRLSDVGKSRSTNGSKSSSGGGGNDATTLSAKDLSSTRSTADVTRGGRFKQGGPTGTPNVVQGVVRGRQQSQKGSPTGETQSSLGYRSAEVEMESAKTVKSDVEAKLEAETEAELERRADAEQAEVTADADADLGTTGRLGQTVAVGQAATGTVWDASARQIEAGELRGVEAGGVETGQEFENDFQEGPPDPDVKTETRLDQEMNIETDVETAVETGVEAGVETSIEAGVDTAIETNIESGVETGVEPAKSGVGLGGDSPGKTRRRRGDIFTNTFTADVTSPDEIRTGKAFKGLD